MAADSLPDSFIEEILQMDACREEKDGWQLSSREEGCEIWTKKVTGHSINLVKGYLEFPGINTDTLLELMTNPVIRKRYDKAFEEYEVVEDHGDNRVLYTVAKMPATVSDRDFVSNWRKRVTDTETVLCSKCTTHPSKPEVAGRVRAESIMSAQVIRQKEGDPTSSTLTSLLQLDLKGWVPTSSVNSRMASGPGRFHASVTEFYNNTYKAEMEAKN